MTTEYIKKKKMTELEKIMKKVTNFSYHDDEKTMAIKARGLEDWEVYHNLSNERENLMIECLQELVEEVEELRAYKARYSLQNKIMNFAFTKIGMAIGIAAFGIMVTFFTFKLEAIIKPQKTESEILYEKAMKEILADEYGIIIPDEPEEQKK